MNLSSKPISSPGRTDKFPPPLMRFLRNNGGSGSKSRGRSRSSPIFIRNKNFSTTAAAAIETQEPSSPKVTCMGQVRVNRSKKPNRVIRRSCHKCIPNPNFCKCLSEKLKSKSFRPVWRKWVLLLGPVFGRNVEISKSEDFEDDEDEEINVFVSVCCSSPPKNAFLLTRSRSLPYRSSSLATRFWGSPLMNAETEEEKKPIENEKSASGEELKLNPAV